MQGADPVNDEFEVGFDASFEAGWHRVSVASQCVMAAFVIAAALGIFGRGPFSHRSVASAAVAERDGKVSIIPAAED